jgi:hypothetical protein
VSLPTGRQASRYRAGQNKALKALFLYKIIAIKGLKMLGFDIIKSGIAKFL